MFDSDIAKQILTDCPFGLNRNFFNNIRAAGSGETGELRPCQGKCLHAIIEETFQLWALLGRSGACHDDLLAGLSFEKYIVWARSVSLTLFWSFNL